MKINKSKQHFDLQYKLCRIFIALILVISSWNSYAQDIKSRYFYLSEEKWFPRQSVRCIFQDSKGYLWIGTNDGLFKYNTVELLNYDMSKYTQTNFLSNTVNSITEDRQGNILVSSESGVGIINPITNKRKVLTKNDESVKEVIVSGDGDIWFYNRRQEIFRIKPSEMENVKLKPLIDLTNFPGHQNSEILQLYSSLSGELILVLNSGLYKIDQQSKKIIPFLFSKHIKRVYEGELGKMFAATDEGLFSLKRNTSENAYRFDEKILDDNSIRLLTAKDNITVGASIKSVYATANGKAKSSFQKLVSDYIKLNNISINVLFVDRASNIWLGTQKGLFKIKRQNIGMSFYNNFSKNVPFDNVVNDMIYDNKGKVWVLTSSQGLYTLDLKSDKLERFKTPIPLKNYNVIKKTYDGNLMLFAENRLIEINNNKGNDFVEHKKYDFYERVTDMVEVSPGEWWITTWKEGMVSFLKPGSVSKYAEFFKQVKEKVGTNHVFGIIKTSNNQIWIICRGSGLFKADLTQKKIVHYTKTGGNKIPSSRLVCVYEDKKENIWIGTRGSGLLKYRPTSDDFQVYDVKDGLPSNTVCDIEETSNGILWVSTLNGIAKFEKEQLISFFSFGLENGIFNPEFVFSSGTGAPHNQLFFGSGNGFYKIAYLPTVKPNDAYPIVWTALKVLNNDGVTDSVNDLLLQEIVKNKSLELSYANRSIKIGFTALDYVSQTKPHYAYRLLGEDTDWKFSSVGQDGVQYLDIEPGEYDFQVKVADDRGHWSEQSHQFHLVVLPSFWTTKWAFVIYLLCFIVIGLVVWFFWRKWYKLNKDLETEVEVTELHNKQMVQYADLSHEIKNRLTLILGPLEQALQGKKVNQVVLNGLYDQAHRLKRLSDQIINIRKNESGGYTLNVNELNIVKHLKKIYKEMKPLAIVKNVKLNFSNQLVEKSGWYDKELIEIIVLNILGNAVKYSIVNGLIEFKLDVEQIQMEGAIKRYLIIRVTDNGIGIPKEDIPRISNFSYRANNAKKEKFPGDGIGLNLVSRLIKIHHGTFSIDSEPSVFTKVEIKIPINKEEYSVNELIVSIDQAPIVLSNDDGYQELIINPKPEINVANKKEHKKVILVVDDEKQIRKILKDTLAKDYKILEAKDGVEAINILEENNIDLIVSDLAMPNMDGLTLCAYVRSDKRFSHLPFLVLTARNSEDQKLVAFKSQVDDFMEKPFSLELLKWRIKSMLRKQEVMMKKHQKVVIADQKIDETDSPDEIFIQKVVNVIDEHIGSEFLNVDFLAEEMNMSRATFYRKMEQLFEESPSNYIKKTRLKKATLYIKSGNYTISEVAFRTGFKTPNYFSKCFYKEFGDSPSEYFNYADKSTVSNR